jgi:SAM-dependent methyltransferase
MIEIQRHTLSVSTNTKMHFVNARRRVKLTVMNQQQANTGFADFDALYRHEPTHDDALKLTLWDFGHAQPTVKLFVECGAAHGRILDPGTGPGHNAIYYASKGHTVTGIDVAAAGIARARHNAQRAGVDVDFRVADATQLDGLDGAFDTVIDSLFYHVFLDDTETQTRYAQALHRVTRPGARLLMLEMGRHNVNGLQFEGLSPENFTQVLPESGWHIDYLGPTTYQNRISAHTLAAMLASGGTPALAQRMKPLQDLLSHIEPILDDHLVHLPAWAVIATRID